MATGVSTSMKKLKRKLRLFAYMLFITLLSIGIGFGVAIIPPPNRREMNTEIKIEMVEKKEDDLEIIDLENQQ